MKKGRILFVIGVLGLNLAFAQDYSFKVMANKGNSEVKSSDGWKSVKTGLRLKTGDELKISENSYIALVHASGKPLELRQSGKYKVADLAAKIGAGSSVLNKYTDFILSSNSAEAKKNRLSATGAVHRGLSDIKVFLPENERSDVFNTTVVVRWDAGKVAGPYVVTIRNMFDDELTKIETTETFLVIDRNDPKLANDEALQIEVKSKVDAKSKSSQHLVRKLSVARQESTKRMLDEMGSEVKEETALNKLILAGFYEENKLLIDAIAAYEQAIKLAPDVASYQEAYDEFMLRNKLKSSK